MQLDQESFYNLQYQGNEYAKGDDSRVEIKDLEKFIKDYKLENKKILEIGCGRGAFQNLVNDWTGVDIAQKAGQYSEKNFVVAKAEALPFNDESFDAVWSITTLEHVACPEKAVFEISRVLKPSGVAYLAPAWHVRSWAAEGYEVRPWSDFDCKGKLIKALIPLRNALWFRAVFALSFRALREILLLFSYHRPLKFRYKKLRPNYEKYWCADSDATCSLDPHEMILWFKSRRWIIQSHLTFLNRFFVRHGAIIVQKPDIKKKYKLAILASHPIQYQVPFFWELAKLKEIDLTVLFCSHFGANEYFDRGFKKTFKWDTDLLSGYNHELLPNVSPNPELSSFFGLINPGVVTKLRKEKYDAVLVHGWVVLTNLLVLISSFYHRVPIILRSETNLLSKLPLWKKSLKHLVLKSLFKNISAFLAIGALNKEFYKSYFLP